MVFSSVLTAAELEFSKQARGTWLVYWIRYNAPHFNFFKNGTAAMQIDYVAYKNAR